MAQSSVWVTSADVYGRGIWVETFIQFMICVLSQWQAAGFETGPLGVVLLAMQMFILGSCSFIVLFAFRSVLQVVGACALTITSFTRL